MTVKIKREVPETELPQNPNEYIERAERAEQRAREFDEAKAQQQQSAIHTQIQQPDNLPPPPDRCNDITFEVAGKQIRMQTPNIALPVLVNKILSQQDLHGADDKVLGKATGEIQALLHVTEIDGHAVTRPTNAVEFQALVNRLGQAGCEAVMGIYILHMPPVQQQEIRIIKKS